MIKSETIKSIDYSDIPEEIFMTITQGEGAPNDTQFTYYVGKGTYSPEYRKADAWFIAHGAEWHDRITIKVSW